MKKEKFHYRVFSYKLHEGTAELLKKQKIESGLSWNRFIYQLITKDEEKET